MRGSWQPKGMSNKSKILAICDIPSFQTFWGGYDLYEPKKNGDFYFKMMVELSKITDPILHLESTLKTSKYLHWGLRAQLQNTPNSNHLFRK